MDFERLRKLAVEAGFTNIGRLSVSTIELKEDVRGMCEKNTCGRYGKSWSCPPGCGTLPECEEKIRKYQEGILLQTVGDLEDEFDGEGMMEASEKHTENMLRFRELLLREVPGALVLGAGSCRICKECTYPESPCRFPESRIESMEANGMLVLEVCRQNGMEYYYGKEKIAYTGCALIG